MPAGSIITGVPTRNYPSSDEKIYVDYLRCLVKNWECSSRYPDSNVRKTAMFTSTSSFTVPLHSENGEYRFSMAVQPQMGDLAGVSRYQAAVAADTLNYDLVDWSSPAAYVALTNGRDPRVDINSGFLTGNNATGFKARTALTGPGALQAQPALNATTGQNFQGPNLVPPPSSYTTTSAAGSLGIVQNTDGSVTVPAGSFIIFMGISFTANASIAGLFPNVNLSSPTMSVQFSNIFASASLVATETDTASTIIAANFSAPTKLYFTIYKNGTGTTPIVANDISTLVTDLYLIPTQFTAPGPSNGAISLIRPVAQTILVSYMGPELINGGRIAGCYVPKGMLTTNYFTAAAGELGNLQKVENLANLEGAYDGRLAEGTFGYWSPYDPSDTEFRTISDMNASTWPAMVVSGSFIPGTTGPPTAISDIVRVRLITTFEFITKSTAFEQQTCCGSQAIIDRVNRTLGTNPHFMANKSHMNWIKSFLGGIMKYGPMALKGAEIAASLL